MNWDSAKLKMSYEIFTKVKHIYNYVNLDFNLILHIYKSIFYITLYYTLIIFQGMQFLNKLTDDFTSLCLDKYQELITNLKEYLITLFHFLP